MYAATAPRRPCWLAVTDVTDVTLVQAKARELVTLALPNCFPVRPDERQRNKKAPYFRGLVFITLSLDISGLAFVTLSAA